MKMRVLKDFLLKTCLVRMSDATRRQGVGFAGRGFREGCALAQREKHVIQLSNHTFDSHARSSGGHAGARMPWGFGTRKHSAMW